jgi:hypothetical protein
MPGCSRSWLDRPRGRCLVGGCVPVAVGLAVATLDLQHHVGHTPSQVEPPDRGDELLEREELEALTLRSLGTAAGGQPRRALTTLRRQGRVAGRRHPKASASSHEAILRARDRAAATGDPLTPLEAMLVAYHEIAMATRPTPGSSRHRPRWLIPRGQWS